jgi:hypothetical protein
MAPPGSRSPLLIFALTACAAAYAQSRTVVVNGQRLSDVQVASLEQRACTRIPNGSYWLDLRTGAWGYMGNPRVQGVFGEYCGRQPKSLSERRQLYRPGEILSQ